MNRISLRKQDSGVRRHKKTVMSNRIIVLNLQEQVTYYILHDSLVDQLTNLINWQIGELVNWFIA